MLKPVVVKLAVIPCHNANPTGWTLSSNPVSIPSSKVGLGGLLLVLENVPLLISLRVVCEEE